MRRDLDYARLARRFNLGDHFVPLPKTSQWQPSKHAKSAKSVKAAKKRK